MLVDEGDSVLRPSWRCKAETPHSNDRVKGMGKMVSPHSLCSVRVVAADMVGDHIEYSIQYDDGTGEQRSTTRRYTAFRQLYKAIATALPTREGFTFPRKRWSGSRSPACLSERTAAFNAIFDAVLVSDDRTVSETVLAFLRDKTGRLSRVASAEGLEDEPPEEEEEEEDMSWKAKAGRVDGGEGYQFGDFARAKIRGLRKLPSISAAAFLEGRDLTEQSKSPAASLLETDQGPDELPSIGQVRVQFGSCWCASNTSWFIELRLCDAKWRSGMLQGSAADTRRGARTSVKQIDATARLPVVRHHETHFLWVLETREHPDRIDASVPCLLYIGGRHGRHIHLGQTGCCDERRRCRW